MTDSTAIGDDRAGSRPGPFVLPEIMDITIAQSLKADILERVTADTALTIDASGVEKIGSAAIQILHAAGLARAIRGKAMTVADPSPAFIQGFKDIGFAEDLKNWSAN
jgi:anti-anti-sigma regulatory factor